MADVFISYARADTDLAHALADRIRATGLSVFVDSHIDSGAEWARRLEHELDDARAVVTLWTPASRASEWVNNEARFAKQRQTLLPVLLRACDLPVEFSGVQTANLDGWDDDAADPRLLAVLADIAAKVRGGSTTAQKQSARHGASSARSAKQGADPLPVEHLINGMEAGSRSTAHLARMWCVLQGVFFCVGAYYVAASARASDYVYDAAGKTWHWTLQGASSLALHFIVANLLCWMAAGALALIAAALVWLISVVAPLWLRPGARNSIHWLNRRFSTLTRQGEPLHSILRSNTAYAASRGYVLVTAEDGRTIVDLHPEQARHAHIPNPAFRWRYWPWMIGLPLIMSVLTGLWIR